MQTLHMTYLGFTAVLAFGVGALMGKIGSSNDNLDQSDQPALKRASAGLRQAGGERLNVGRARNLSGAGNRGSELSDDLCELALNTLDLPEDASLQMANSLKNEDVDKKTIAEYSLYLSWLRQNPLAAMNSSIGQYDNNTKLRSLMFEQWADEEPLAAAEKFRENPYVLHERGYRLLRGSSVKVAKSLAKKLKASNPQAAEDWASTLPAELKKAALQELADPEN